MANIPQGKALWRDAAILAAACGCADSITGRGPRHVGQETNHKKNERVKRVAVIVRAQEFNVDHMFCISVIRCFQL